MAHWGWYWKVKEQHTARTECSSLPSIDSFKLLKNHAATGFNVRPFDIKADLQDNALQISYRNQKASSYTITIDRQPCRFGGFRQFFKCPLCQSRMRFLYLASKSTFLCRKCLNLSYTSQNLRPVRRYAYMQDKLAPQTPDKKPKYQHNKTYAQKKKLYNYYRHKELQATNQEIRMWYGDNPLLDKAFDYVPEKPR